MVEEDVKFQEDCVIDTNVKAIFWMVVIGSSTKDSSELHRCYGVAFKWEIILSKAMEVSGLFS